LKLSAILLGAAGLGLIVFGRYWGTAVFDSLPGTALYEWLSLSVPFLPIALIAIGALLFVRASQR